MGFLRFYARGLLIVFIAAIAFAVLTAFVRWSPIPWIWDWSVEWRGIAVVVGLGLAPMASLFWELSEE